MSSFIQVVRYVVSRHDLLIMLKYNFSPKYINVYV